MWILISLDLIKFSNFSIFSSNLSFFGIAFSIIFFVYIPSTLCLLINFVKISLILSSKPEIALGIFIGFSFFKVLIPDFLETFFTTVFFVFLTILGLEFLLDFALVFFFFKIFLTADFFLDTFVFFLTTFFFLFYHKSILKPLRYLEG